MAVASATAQTPQYCPSNELNVCYSFNVPAQTASTGSGDIYFQIRGPVSKSWIALGQGGKMAGSNIFVLYANAAGNNVTLSPRLGKGHAQPEHDSEAQVSLLNGTGIENGVMTANVRCEWPGIRSAAIVSEAIFANLVIVGNRLELRVMDWGQYGLQIKQFPLDLGGQGRLTHQQ